MGQIVFLIFSFITLTSAGGTGIGERMTSIRLFHFPRHPNRVSSFNVITLIPAKLSHDDCRNDKSGESYAHKTQGASDVASAAA